MGAPTSHKLSSVPVYVLWLVWSAREADTHTRFSLLLVYFGRLASACGSPDVLDSLSS